MTAVMSPRRTNADRPLSIAVAIVVASVVFLGFSQTFYLRGFVGSPGLSNLLLIHGVVMTSWIALLIAQVWLVAAGRTDLHRRLGIVGACIALLVLIVGVMAAVDAGRRGFSPSPQVTPIAFMAVPIIDVIVFAVLVGVALLNRRRSATHKRLILLATLGILTPAVARLPIDMLKQTGLPAFFGVTVFCVVAVVLWDTIRNRRLHPAFAWGGAFLIASIPFRIFLSQTAGWASAARWLIS